MKSVPAPVVEAVVEEPAAAVEEVKSAPKSSEEKLTFHDEREHVNIVFLGHVDAGKSTLSGQILMLTDQVSERDIEKLKEAAEENGRGSWWAAYLMDTNPDERSKGKTVEVGRAQFSTAKKRYTILDAPGHNNYVPAMITGAVQADVGVLVVSARKGEFEAGFQNGGQTREHAILAKTLGIQNLVVGINKMDDETVGWDNKERFDQIVNGAKNNVGIHKFLTAECGFSSKRIVYVPFSALSGENVKDPISRKQCPFYDGKTLLDTIDSIDSIDRSLTAPLRVPVLDKYKDQGTVVAIGKVESGVLRNDSLVTIMPTGIQAKVVNIGVDDAESDGVAMVKPGENVNVSLKGVDEDRIHAGDVICGVDNLCPRAKSFDAEIYLFGLDKSTVLTAGYTCVLHVHTASVEVEITQLLYELVTQQKPSKDKSSKKDKSKKGKSSKKDKPRVVKKRAKPFARSGNFGVKIELSSAVVSMEKYSDYKQLARFTLRDKGNTIAIGKVMAVYED